jgi:hypothetical protein
MPGTYDIHMTSTNCTRITHNPVEQSKRVPGLKPATESRIDKGNHNLYPNALQKLKRSLSSDLEIDFYRTSNGLPSNSGRSGQTTITLNFLPSLYKGPKQVHCTINYIHSVSM